MAIFEDILGVIIIVVIFLVAFFMVSTFLVVREVQVLTEEQQNYLRDYYSTSIDVFLSTRSPSTDKPFSLVIGEMIDHSKKQGDFGETESLEKEINESLSNLIGKNNFYVEILPIITNITISFVMDGSNSLTQERQLLNQSLPFIKEKLNEYFFQGQDVIQYKIYKLGGLGGQDLCSDNFDNIHDCDVLYDEIYKNTSVITKPNFGFASYEDWKNNAPLIIFLKQIGQERIIENIYIEGDWASGIYYAHKKFLENPNNNESYHIIIPISDELSTSSMSDKCFNLTSLPETRACFLCEESCPTNRSNRDFQNIKNYINNSIIIPIISDPCTFVYESYNNSLNNRNESGDFGDVAARYNLTNANLPINQTGYICQFPFNCPGCRIDNDGNVCFKENCMHILKDQMEELANHTGGTVINISDILELPNEIINTVTTSLEELKLQIGNEEILNASTRFAFEKRVVMPNNLQSEFIVVVRDTPFTAEDSEWHSPPVQPVEIEILSPHEDDAIIEHPDKIKLTPRSLVELKIRTNVGSECRFTNNSGKNFNDMWNLTRIGNSNEHNISYDVINDTTYTIYFQCNGTTESYNLSDKKNITFKILEDICVNYGYRFCDDCADDTEGIGYFPNLNETKKCCLNCAECEGFSQCEIDEECENNVWTDIANRCCSTRCGNCGTVDFPICAHDEFCDGNSVIFGVDSCCENECKNCTIAGGNICSEDEICVGDWFDEELRCCQNECKNCTQTGGVICLGDEMCQEWEEESIGCCQENECKNCTEIGGITCENDQFCNATWFNETLRCCDGICGSCHDENHFICEEGITTCNVTEVTWGGETCCPEECKNCTELGGLTCDDDEICMNWLNQDIICCEENECKNCTDLGGIECNEICTGYESVELGCCKVDNCGDCEFHGGNICEAHETCDGNWAGGPEDKCCIGECNDEPQLSIAFIPINWQGNLESFNTLAEEHYNFLIDNIPLKECPNRAEKILGTVNCGGLICNSPYCGLLNQFKNCAQNQGINDYDYLIGITNVDALCGDQIGGFACPGMGTVFVKTDPVITAHELGHEWGLNDEYFDACGCGWTVDPNANCLKHEFSGFDPANLVTPHCENYCELYQGMRYVYCLGNLNQEGGRDIMSYVNAPSPRAFAQPSWDHLLTVEIVNCW